MSKSLNRLVNVIEQFRTLDSEFPIQNVHLLLAIAQNPGITYPELLKRIGTSKAGIARNVAWFTKDDPKQLDFVVSYENPDNRREKCAKLTPKGERFVRTIINLLDPSE